MKRQSSRLLLIVRFTLLALFLLAPLGAPAYAEPAKPPNRALVPLVMQYAELPPPEPLADVAWRWGDATYYPGRKGIRVTDLNGDGQNEVLSADQAMLVALKPTGAYHFEQFWAVPMGVSWGIADVVGSGANQIWIVDQNGLLSAYAPFAFAPTKTVRLPLSTAVTLRQAVVADLFGDGKQELLGWTSTNDLVAYNLPRLAEVWRYHVDVASSSYTAPMIAVGQVDNDPALEIIVTTGAVIDPQLKAEQWRYNEGFGTVVRTGDVDGDGRAEVIAMDDWRYITAFDIDLRSPKWQIDTSDNDTIELADVAGDATPEIILGEGQWGKVKVYDAKTQALLWAVDNTEHGIDGVGVGDADTDGELDLIWGSGGSSTGPDYLFFTPISGRAAAYKLPDFAGPFSVAALQMDNDRQLELMVFATSRDAGYGQNALPYFVVDSVTGAEQPDLKPEIDSTSSYNGTWALLQANVDGDPSEELILGTGNDLYLLDQDGKRITKASFTDRRIPDWVGDVDGDGQLELVAHTSNRVSVLALNSLATEWQTVNVSTGVAGVAVADVDADGHFEIVFHGYKSYLQAYDGQTRTLDWQMPSSQKAGAIAIGNADAQGGLEMVTIDEDGRLAFYDAATRALLFRTAQVAGQNTTALRLAFVHMTNLAFPQLAVITSDGVSLFRHPYDARPTQTFSAGQSQGYWSAATMATFTDTDNDHHMDILVADTLSVTRYRVRSDFPDLIPPGALSISPRPGADLIARNTFAEALFYEEMDPATMVGTNAQLRANGAGLPATLSYDPATRILRLTPTGFLPPDATITVWLGPGLHDLEGNGLDGNLNGVGGEPDDAYTWQFSTGNGTDNVGPAVRNLTLAPNPLWSGAPLLVTADTDDTNPAAASTVRRAEYFVDAPGAAGTGQPLAAVDGRFDGRTEAVTVTLDTTNWHGPHTLYVRAEDSVGNWGEVASANLEIVAESAANWPQFGGDAAHTGYNPAQPKVKGFTPAWEVDVFAALNNSHNPRPMQQVAVGNGTVVAAGDSYFGNGGVIALATNDGREQWRRLFSNKYSVNPPSIAYGTVYFQQGNHGSDTFLYALDVRSGQQLWRAPFGAQWEQYYAPTVAAGKVFIAGGSYGGMYGFDAFNGRELWFQNTGQYDRWTPAYRNGTVYSFVHGMFAAWEPKYGAQLWSVDVGWDWQGYSMSRIAALSDTTAYLVTNSSSGGDLVAIDLASHAEKWRKTGKYTVSVALADNEVYGLDGQTLRVLDAATGAELWSYAAGVDLVGSPVVTAGNVYFASAGHTWVLDRSTHALTWEVDKGGWLSVANDQLFIAQADGKLSVFNAQH